jgi:hypothetical protein
MQEGGQMGTQGSQPYPDAARIAELFQKIRTLRSDLSAMIEHSRNSKSVSRLIMESSLLDEAMQELGDHEKQGL